MNARESKEKRKAVFFSHGKLYFSRSLEQRFFCYATVVMAVLGLLYHWGIISG